MKNTLEKTTYTLLTPPETKIPPSIIFSRTALKWIKNLIKAHSGEVGFYGVVDTLEDYTFFVRDIFYPKQQLVSAATCEISPEGGTLIAEWLIAHERSEDIGRMILWGHSHHSMGVGPSGQDNTQALDLMKTTGNHLIRIIVNNEELIGISFFDFEKQVRFDNVKWEEEKENDDAFLAEKLQEINAMVSSNLTTKQKLDAINRITSEDLEEKVIIAKIEELKKVNIPADTWPNSKNYWDKDHTDDGYDYGGYGKFHEKNANSTNHNVRQLTFLDKFSHVNNTKRNKRAGKNNTRVINSNSYLDDSRAEVEEIIKEFEGGVL
jgi:hypothetical protein